MKQMHATPALPAALSLSLLTLLIGNAYAAPAPEASDAAMPTVVVTASAVALNVQDAPASISVITREEIERQPVYDLGTLLRRIPGVSGGLAPNGEQSKVKLRGLPENYTLILIDGKRQGNSADTNYRPDLGRQDLNWLSPEMIERIEVVRGPMSSLYGSDAMGGVINIITRKIPQKWSGSASANLTRPQDSDRGDATQMMLNVAGPLAQGVGLRLGGSVTRQKPDETTGGFVPAGREAPNGVGGSRDENFNAALNWTLAPGHLLSFDGSYGTQRATQSGTQTAPDRPLISSWGASKLVRKSAGMGYEGRWGKTEAKFNLYHNRYDNNDGAASSRAASTILDGRVNQPLKLANIDHLLTLGGQWKRDTLFNNQTIGTIPIDYLGHAVVGSSLSRNTSALFAEDQVFLSDAFTLTLGARLDHDAKFGNHTSPRAYVVYRPASEWTVKGGVSQGFRAPTLKESTPGAATQSRGGGCGSLAPLGWTSRSGGCYMAGNADLKPETSTNAELGLNFQRAGWDLGMTYFHTNFKDKIEYDALGFFHGYWWTRMKNIQKARTRGIEASANVPLASSLTWRNNLTYMMESKNLTTGATLLATPKLSLFSALGWQASKPLYLELSAQYTGKQLHGGESFGVTFAKAYTVTDLTANYAINPALTLRAGINNLTEEGPRADGKTNYYVPSRRFFLGLTSRF
ncbi:TonB-dependent receptor domain-containing protein [Massilia sp. NR 4-1]|uniref:TonB-dependent receptor domain-containing protein n=1 Tax=Massilia sp. NR 4-1 TaxID=1678028 RepID=UPI000AA4C649|nr:TonB-dependent receptor [Massilia sp. NR 4-1]